MVQVLPQNPTFHTLLAQALGQAGENIGQGFLQGRQQASQQQGISDLLSEFLPDLDEQTRRSISRSGVDAKDIISNVDKISKQREVSPETKRAKNLLATAKQMKGLLKYTGSEVYPGAGFGGVFNRESVQKRAEFNSLAADFAGFFRDLDTKGQLPQGLYEKLIEPRMPNDELSDKENLGRIDALESLAKRFGGLEQDSSNEKERPPLTSFYR